MSAIPQEYIKKFTKEDYYALHKEGRLSRHTELLEGVLIEKMTISPKHSFIVSKLHEILSSTLLKRYIIREEKPLSTPTSEPEPDLSIVTGTLDDFRDSHPTTADWVIEVAVTSLSLDLSKRKIYASAGIPEYWIVDPEEGRILIFSEPTQEGYKRESVVRKTEFIKIPVEPFAEILLDWM
ncbi:MAG: Uma2 family endonuclease [Spirochaetia bacterium]|nr:Uma2 family endonuclease [Spirochaetia bacterium]